MIIMSEDIIRHVISIEKSTNIILNRGHQSGFVYVYFLRYCKTVI